MRALPFTIVFLLTALPVWPETIVVRPDGTGDLPTIQAAIEVARDGDVVELAEGTFSGDGNRDLDFLGKTIAVRSASGDPKSCILDCGGSVAAPHRAFRFHRGEPADAQVIGISITGGWVPADPGGGAVLCEGATAPTIRSCVFRANQGSAMACMQGSMATLSDCLFEENSGQSGGAVYCESATITITGCRFVANTAELSGGAMCAKAASAVVTGCTFTGNAADWSGAVDLTLGNSYVFRNCVFAENSAGENGAFYVFYSTATIEGCTFARNSSESFAGALGTGKMAYTHLTNCTFWGNGSPNGGLLLGEYKTTLDNCIIASGTQGPAIHVAGIVELACCDLWGNAGGDWVGDIAGQYGKNGNICENPQFCDPEAGDFTLASCSPCAPFSWPNPECDLIGAWPVGCGGTPVARRSWGSIKSFFQP